MTHPSPADTKGKMAEYRGQVIGLVVYYFVLLALSLVLLFDLWIAHFNLLRYLGVSENVLKSPLLVPLASTIMGGMIGGVLYNIRMLHYYYARTGQYDPRWMGKYITGPLEAGLLALLVYALARGGVVTLSGVSPQSGEQAAPATWFAAFGLGGLVGFGTRDVVGWLQDLTKTMFGEKYREEQPPKPNETNDKTHTP